MILFLSQGASEVGITMVVVVTAIVHSINVAGVFISTVVIGNGDAAVVFDVDASDVVVVSVVDSAVVAEEAAAADGVSYSIKDRENNFD